MNLLIHQWDVPSINVLGAIDNGAGQWATGYQYDGSHPNSAGHREFTYSMVPSLFDALDAGKPQPQWVSGTSLRMKPDSSDFRLEFTAEEVLHPFTLSFDIQTGSTGQVAGFKTTNGPCSITIDNNGCLKYASAKSAGITGQTAVNDNQWHRITLTHYMAMGKTFLYVDKVLQGSIAERIVSSTFNLGARTGPAANYRNLLFYRSGINAGEVAALVDNNMLKSSLEIYAPLDEKGKTGTDTLVNLAQSTNKVVKVKLEDPGTPIEKVDKETATVSIYPNPAESTLFIHTNDTFRSIVLTDSNGKSLRTLAGNTSKVDIATLTPGIYFLQFSNGQTTLSRKFIKSSRAN
jgi:hypothetical protein